MHTKYFNNIFTCQTAPIECADMDFTFGVNAAMRQ